MKLQTSLQPQLADQSTEIICSGLKVNQLVKLNASTNDQFGIEWRSQVCFRANEEGEVNTALQSPIKGNYSTADALGLFWSLQPVRKQAQYNSFPGLAKPNFSVKLTVKVGRKVLAETQLTRQLKSPDVERIEVEEENVAGVLFLPESSQPLPAVIMFHGTAGLAMLEPVAAMLAAHGFAVFLVAYYRYKDLPDELYELPLKRFKHGVDWLKQHARINPDKVAGFGFSKGAEALLATASYYPDLGLQSIIAVSPSNVVWQGIGKGKPKPYSSWSLYNEPLAFLSPNYHSAFKTVLFSKLMRKLKLDKLMPIAAAVHFVKAYKKAFNDRYLTEEAELPVEKIKAPVFLFSGDADQLWPTTMMCQRMQQRLQQKNFAYAVEHFNYPDAGHVFLFPGVPANLLLAKSPLMTLALGGTVAGNARAWQDYWQKILMILQDM